MGSRWNIYVNIYILGSNYDVKVCREPLVALLVELEDVKYVIKRGGSYACIATDSFRFLDIAAYLSPATSYDAFLKAFNASGAKSYFPYEYFSSLDLLDSSEFPRYDDYFSSMRQRNTLEPREGEDLLADEITVIGRTPSRQQPLTTVEVVQIGRYRYTQLRETFTTNNWTMRDYLTDYNNRLVGYSGI